MSLWAYNLYMEEVMEDVEMKFGRVRIKFQRRGEDEDYLPCCMWMIWYYVISEGVEVLLCKVSVEGRKLESVSEYKYLRFASN